MQHNRSPKLLSLVTEGRYYCKHSLASVTHVIPSPLPWMSMLVLGKKDAESKA